jgi:DNA-binding FadR family transcriptional regulator
MLAAEKATPEEISRLEDIARRADGDLATEDLLKLDFEFYLDLSRSAKNRVFQLLINTTRAAVQSHAAFFAQVTPPPTVMRKCHRDVIAALKAREADKAGKAVNEYLLKAQEMLTSLFPARSRPEVKPAAEAKSAR